MKFVNILSILILFSACSETKQSKEDNLNDILSNLEIYQESDRIAPNCADVDALETNGKYSKKLKNYTGKIKVCNNQGRVITLYTLKNGKHEGCFYTYDDSGLLIGKTYYQDDQKHGDYIFLDEAGRILIKAQYENNVLVKCDGPLCKQIQN
jgi:YD repeat-containing protein